ncbi:sensor histidine kinase [Geodermatophilus sp. SYSU D00815]
MPTVSRWWGSRSDPQRLDLYTRWSFYGWLGLTPLLALLTTAPAAADAGPVPVVLFLAGATAVGVLGLAIARAGLAGPRGTAPVPRRLLIAAAGAALATTAVSVSAFPDAEAGAVEWGVALPWAMVLTACSPFWPARVLALLSSGVGLLVGAVVVATGGPPDVAVVLAVVFGVTVAAVTTAFRFSVWVLDVVVEMDRTRGVQLQLAVAEERLRFARDLHDVMGRNLSAIAVKSQLAGELVRRQRPEAADEVADISRIAEQSLREVRDVVRGYRTADLAGELAGARSVLRAAGVDCTVAGEEHGGGLPEGVQTALGWGVREAVTNVLRHSRASACTITLAVEDGAARLRVVNDGVGPDVDRWGNGLSGLAERLAGAGGRLAAAPEGDRFVLTATVPVGEAA